MNIRNYLIIGLFFLTLIIPGSATFDYQVIDPISHTSISLLGPSADIAVNQTTGDAPLTVQFMDKSSGERYTWFWKFGDGGFSVEQNPVHTYTQAGGYTPELSITGPNGKSSVRSPITIMVTNPLFRLKPYQTPVLTKNTSLKVNVSRTTIASTVLSLPTLMVATSTPTKIPIEVILTKVRPVAIMQASPVSGQVPLTVHFTDSSTGNPNMWRWDFGDGNSSYSKDPVYIYTKPGNFTPRLSVSNSEGRDDATGFIVIQVWNNSSIQKSATTQIIITKIDTVNIPSGPSIQISSIDPFTEFPPLARFSAAPLEGVAPLTVKFVDHSLGTPYFWRWDFGDGNSDYKMNPVHVYKEPGTYLPKVTIRNGWGESVAESTYVITVHAPG